MGTALILVALIAVLVQVWRVNILLHSIYLILEKQQRPATSDNDFWVEQLRRDLKDHYPPGPSWGTWLGCLGLIVAIVVFLYFVVVMA